MPPGIRPKTDKEKVGMVKGLVLTSGLNNLEMVVFKFVMKVANYDENNATQVKQVVELIKQVGVDEA